MFRRTGELFIVTTDNIRGFEVMSEWAFFMWKKKYLVKCDVFSNATIYHICIPMSPIWDETIKKRILKWVELRKVTLIEEPLL